MAISFLDDINLNDLEALNLVVQNLGSDPTGVVGKIIYNTGSNTIKYYNGTSWIELDGLGGLAGSGTVGTVPIFVTNTTTLGDSQLQTTGSGGSQTFLFNTLSDVTFKGSISFDSASGGIKDETGGLGNSGQLLSSTGTSIDWINAPVSYTKWVLLEGSYFDIEDGDTFALSSDSAYPGLNFSTSKTGTVATTLARFYPKDIATTAGLSDYTADFLIYQDTSDSFKAKKTLTGNIPLNSFGAATAVVDMGSNKIKNLSDPTQSHMAATKAYVDSSVEGGLTVKGGFLASTGAITTGGNLTVGGSRVAIEVGDYYVVTGAGNFFGNAATPLTVGDSVLVQTAAVAGASTEADFAVIQSDTDLATASTVGIGNVNASSANNNEGLSLSYSNGTGTVGFDIKNGLVAATALADGDGFAMFQGSAGAQGNKSITSQLMADYFRSKSSFASTSSSGTSHVFNHNLGSIDVIVQLFNLAEGLAGETVYADVTRTNTNTVTVTTAASANIRCLIQRVG